MYGQAAAEAELNGRMIGQHLPEYAKIVASVATGMLAYATTNVPSRRASEQRVRLMDVPLSWPLPYTFRHKRTTFIVLSNGIIPRVTAGRLKHFDIFGPDGALGLRAITLAHSPLDHAVSLTLVLQCRRSLKDPAQEGRASSGLTFIHIDPRGDTTETTYLPYEASPSFLQKLLHTSELGKSCGSYSIHYSTYLDAQRKTGRSAEQILEWLTLLECYFSDLAELYHALPVNRRF